MVRKAPSFFISRCPEILALQIDLQADFLGSQLRPFPAQLSRILGVEPIYPRNPHSFVFFNVDKDVYVSPDCVFQGSLFE